MLKKNSKNDNRMAWVRNLARLSKSSRGSYNTEFEIASECRIVGILNYNKGKIVCSLFSMEKDEKGLYHYLVRIKYPKYSGSYNEKADKKGYYFKGGEIGELLALFSLYFQCRFYLVATYQGEQTLQQLKTKFENNFLYKKVASSIIHPKIFPEKAKTFAKELSAFLDSVKKLNKTKHQSFILACYHYARALKEVGIDSEMVFIRLVSSIETLSKEYKLGKMDNPLNGEKFHYLFNRNSLSIEQLQQIKEILNVSKRDVIQVEKSKRKFVRFIQDLSKGALKGGNWKAKHVKITRENLPKVLTAIYDARSNYLHNGEPMYLSQFMYGATKWDTDPSLGMIIDNREFPASKKLPYTYWFENVVRSCLLNYLSN